MQRAVSCEYSPAFNIKQFQDLLKIKQNKLFSIRAEEEKSLPSTSAIKRRNLGLSLPAKANEFFYKKLLNREPEKISIDLSQSINENHSRRNSDTFAKSETEKEAPKINFGEILSKVKNLHNTLLPASLLQNTLSKEKNEDNEKKKQSLKSEESFHIETKEFNRTVIDNKSPSDSFQASNEAGERIYEFFKGKFQIEKSNRKLFEELYNEELLVSKKIEEENQGLRAEIEVLKASNEIQRSRLLNEINSLKIQNLDMQKKLRQKNQIHSQYAYSFFKKSDVELPENDLNLHNKEDFVNELKIKYNKLSKQVLKQADDLYEKNIEIKQLYNQKASLNKELEKAKQQVGELEALKEHVAYLLSSLQTMRQGLTSVPESNKDQYFSSKERNKAENIIEQMSHIANKAKSKIDIITENSEGSMKEIKNTNSKFAFNIRKSLLGIKTEVSFNTD